MTWALHHTECVEFMRGMADKSVCHSILDPPYEKEAHSKGRRVINGSVQDAVGCV